MVPALDRPVKWQDSDVPRVQLVHWNQAEGRPRAAALRKAGYTVRFEPFEPFPAAFKKAKAAPPDAFVIDLSRLPSAGRDVAMALREVKVTRFVPIVFVGGDPVKVERIKQQLPDATYTEWSRVRSALRGALSRTVTEPVVPRTRLDGYSGTPLPRKLGVKPGFVVGLIGAPNDFAGLLGSDVRIAARGRADLTMLFARSRADLVRRFEAAVSRSGGEMWIAWPKQAGPVRSDLTQQFVRDYGLVRGLVDYKVAAIDSTWSALRFTRRAHSRDR
jgi:hypothetical protein